MKVSFKPSYIRSVKKLDSKRAENVQKAFESLIKLLQIGEKPYGLGLKQLKPDIWEIRAGLIDRIIFCRKKDCIEFIIAGTHDEIKRYLKNI